MMPLFLFLSISEGIILTKIPPFDLGLSTYSHTSIYCPVTNELLIYGGLDELGSKIDKIWTYTFKDNNFYELPNLSSFLPGGRSGHCSFYDASEIRMLVLGGEVDKGLTNEILDYDIKLRYWKLQSSTLPVALANMACVFEPGLNFGYFFGGLTPNGETNDVYQFFYNNLTFEKLKTLGEPPSPRQYSSVSFSENSLYVWGGENSEIVKPDLFVLNLTTLQWNTLATQNSQNIEPRSRLKSLISNNTFYAFPGRPYSTSIFTLDLTSLKWQIIQDSLIGSRILYSLTYGNEEMILYGGLNSSTIFNDMIFINFSNVPSIKQFTKNMVVIPPRQDTVFTSIYDKIIVFGGETYAGLKLNDLWRFDFDLYSWESLQSSGTPPSPRSGPGSAQFGYSLYIFGGESSDYLNDFFLLNLLDMSWSQIFPIGSVPSPRKYPCMCGLSPNIFIYGGIGANGWTSELWLYNIATYSFTLLSTNSLFSPGQIKVNSCVVNLSGNNTEVSFLSPLENNNYLFTFSLGNYTGWVYPQVITGLSVLANEIFVVKAFTDLLFFSVLELREKNSNYYVYALNTSKSAFDAMLVAEQSHYSIGSSVLLLGSSFYYFGGYTAQSSSVISPVQTNYFAEISGVRGLCSTGFYLEEGTCTVCPVGTYNDQLSASTCKSCPIGTFNAFEAASSEFMCLPCPYQTFSDRAGASACLQCPNSYYCPAGSNMPELTQSPTQNFTSIQPHYSLGDLQQANLINQLSLVIIVFFLSLLSFFFWIFKKFKVFLARFDIFFARHNQITGNPMEMKNTNTGAFFSLIFFGLSIYFFIEIISNYALANISETKTLVPSLIQSDLIINGDVYIEVIFFLYAGDCANNNNECNSEITLANQLKGYDFKIFSCTKIDTQCIINIFYRNCQLLSESQIILKLSEKLSYAAFISINVTAESSIPGQFSTIIYTITPSSQNSVFRGIVPTIAYFTALGTVFQYDSLTNTGFHIFQQKSNQIGSEVDISQVFTMNSIGLIIDIQLSDKNLMIQRYDNMDSLTFIITLVTTILGILSMIGFFLYIFEIFYMAWKNKIKTQKKISKMHQKSIAIDKILNSKMKIIENYKPSQLEKPKKKKKIDRRSISFIIFDK